MKFFNYVRGRVAAGYGAFGKWLGDSKLMNGLIYDCNLEKRAWDSGLAQATYPESIMTQYPYRGYAVVKKEYTTTLTAYDIEMMFRDMLYNEREQLLLAYPKLSRVGCSSFSKNFTEGRKHLTIACIFDTKPPEDFKIEEPKDEFEENYCKIDNDCIYTSGSKCFEKLCYVPPHIYANGH
ncbi:unnamed protein product [Heligmosomoides polygyrus]|uniref:SCP domain-containing protein n=1 Tax=Heligmosomoides polygyrus TaxID=6339 RepID=A0A183FPR3_HELPZ|nr:unnamed protein product [Heligmosomoides polygyrus]